MKKKEEKEEEEGKEEFTKESKKNVLILFPGMAVRTQLFHGRDSVLFVSQYFSTPKPTSLS